GYGAKNSYILTPQNQLTQLAINERRYNDWAVISANPALLWLSFDSNNLTSLPESIGQLQNLKILYLHSNNLTSLPESLHRLKNLGGLGLAGNPVTRHLKGIEKNLYAQELITYLLEVQDKNTKLLNEAKVLVVGDERVGKTSLINRLLGRRHNPNQKSTPGIDIQNHQLDNDIRVNIWDFAG
ncbi:MAG: 50S ribosome-binding GTPase, partial [Algicola sp.]|nr:50S ribosome-binding GTPase [Algicola sp.]